MSLPEETLVRLAENHYFWVIERAQAQQDNLFRIYFFSASLILSCGFFTIREKYLSFHNICGIVFFCLSIIISSFVIIFCLHHMRGKYIHKFPNLIYYIDTINNCSDDKLKSEKLKELLKKYMELSETGKSEMVKRSDALHKVSIMLIHSLIFMLLSWLFTFFASLNNI